MSLFDWIKKLKRSGTAESAQPSGPEFEQAPTLEEGETTKLTLGVRAKRKLKVLADRSIEWIQTLRHSPSLRSVQAYSFYLALFAAACAAYFLADTVSLFTESLIPDAPSVPAPRVVAKHDKRIHLDDFAAITQRNIFNSQGLIPEETNGQGFGPAHKSNLPFNLIGTVVLKDELKSMATIEDRSQNLVFPVRIDETFASRARVTKIEHLKVYFINQDSGQLEYIEIVEDIPQLKAAFKAPISRPSRPSSSEGISQKNDTSFEIDRGLIDKSMANWNDLMNQARAVPSFNNGQLEGFKLIAIDQGSVYEKIGLKKNDVITAVNGEALTDPGKPLQMVGELKNMSNLQLTVKRNGVATTLNYDIK